MTWENIAYDQGGGVVGPARSINKGQGVEKGLRFKAILPYFAFLPFVSPFPILVLVSFKNQFYHRRLFKLNLWLPFVKLQSQRTFSILLNLSQNKKKQRNPRIRSLTGTSKPKRPIKAQLLLSASQKILVTPILLLPPPYPTTGIISPPTIFFLERS